MSFSKHIIAFLFFCQTITAQQFNYKNITTNEGLASSEVFNILQDKQGYIWFATNHGVTYYNGKEFTAYSFADGLADNTILRICEDSKGRIWFTSQSNDIGYWENGKIYKPALSKLLNQTIPAWDHITTLYIDKSDNIWFNTLLGVYFSAAQNQHTTLIKKEPFFNCNTPIEIIDDGKVIDFKNRKWKTYAKPDPSPFYQYQFAYRIGKNIYRDTISMPKNELKLTRNRVDCVYGKDGTLFYAEDFNLFCISKGKKIEVKKFDHEIVKLVIDHQDNLWITFLKGGVSYYKNRDIHSKPISLLNDCTVSDVCMDHEAGTWISTLEKGIFYIPSLSIRSYSNVPNLDDHIICLGVVNNKMIVGTFGDRQFEATTDTIVSNTFLQQLAPPNTKLVSIRTIDDKIYVLWNSKPVIMLNKSLEVVQTKIPNLFLRGGVGFAVTEDKNIWLLQTIRVKKLNYEKGKELTGVHHTPFRLTCAIGGKGSSLFIGSKRGLYSMNQGKISWLNRIDPLLKCPISQLLKDKEDNLWIASAGNGLLKLKDNKVTQIGVKDGLLSNICSALEQDSAGNIWVGTNKGLSCVINPLAAKGNLDIKNLTINNGLNSNEITKLCLLNDTLWVGSKSGLNAINLCNVFTNSIASPTYIRSVLVNNKIIDNNRSVFDHNQNSIKITLDGLSYSASTEHQYRFRMIGLDSTWQETKTDEVLFNSLPPGNYHFQATVANPDGKWSNKIASYHFTINKPFWLTWWFILIEIGCGAYLVYLIVHLQTRTITRREQEKLRINKLLTEYQMKALTAQMNPHFIFNAINSIQNFIIQNHSTLAYDYLIKFSKLIRLVLNNSNANEISLRQELETLNLYVELEQLRFENSFNYHVHIASQLDTDSLVIPALLLQPYIENAIWHGLMPLKNRKGAIDITIIEQEKFLKITITDNGIGRAASDQIKKKIVNNNHQSVGMELTEKRIKVFGRDSEFSLQIIDNYDTGNNPMGTTVEIILPMIEMY